jgi:HPt (histidine-containing phosphotransfer) domain-containing protein
MHPTLDPAPLAALRAQARDFDPTFIPELIAVFLTETTSQLTLLEHASSGPDPVTCASVAHRLKSSCKAIGAFRLASLLEIMEGFAKSSALASLPDLITEIWAEYGRLERVLYQERYA